MVEMKQCRALLASEALLLLDFAGELERLGCSAAAERKRVAHKIATLLLERMTALLDGSAAPGDVGQGAVAEIAQLFAHENTGGSPAELKLSSATASTPAAAVASLDDEVARWLYPRLTASGGSVVRSGGLSSAGSPVHSTPPDGSAALIPPGQHRRGGSQSLLVGMKRRSSSACSIDASDVTRTKRPALRRSQMR